MKRLWITRTSPGADDTAVRLRALGFEPIVAPVLEVRFVPADIDLSDVGALAFTSANGVRAFAAASDARGLPTFTVGDATGRAARLAGFRDVISASADVGGLAATLTSDARDIHGSVLHPGAAEQAGDLVGALLRAGLGARAVTLYETVAKAVPAELMAEVGSLHGVLVYSPRAGRRLADLLSATQAPALNAYCLSPAVAASLRGLDIGPVVTAALPDEDALLSLLS